MIRWLGWSVFTAGVIIGGYLASLNPTPVGLVVAPGRVVQVPLAVVLTTAMAAGALAVGAVTALATLRRAGTALAARRDARRHARDERHAELAIETMLGDGDVTAAIASTERDLQTRPESPRLLRRLRDLHARAERWPEALAITERLVASVRAPALLDDELSALRALRYETARTASDARRGARALLVLAREDPAFVAAWASAGDRFLEAGRPVRARRTWLRGAKHQPAPPLLERLETHDAGAGRSGRTTRTYRRLHHRHPGDTTLQLFFARHLLRAGATAEAAALLESPLDSTVAEALRGELARRERDFERAAATFAHALGPSFGLALGWTCIRCGHESARWVARCGGCERWNTFTPTRRAPGASQDSSA
jgi:tetratricopeptide (TPR) repeat protein